MVQNKNKKKGGPQEDGQVKKQRKSNQEEQCVTKTKPTNKKHVQGMAEFICKGRYSESVYMCISVCAHMCVHV